MITHSYKTHYYCQRGCGKDRGWFWHGEEAVAKNGCKICPVCGTHLRTKSRWNYGKHRVDIVERL